MRTRRIKSEEVGLFYHVVNRIAGEPGFLPFDDVAREKLVELLYDVSRLFTVEPISYRLMGNRFHILTYASAEVLPPDQGLDRYNNYYRGKKVFKGHGNCSLSPTLEFGQVLKAFSRRVLLSARGVRT